MVKTSLKLLYTAGETPKDRHGAYVWGASTISLIVTLEVQKGTVRYLSSVTARAAKATLTIADSKQVYPNLPLTNPNFPGVSGIVDDSHAQLLIALLDQPNVFLAELEARTLRARMRQFEAVLFEAQGDLLRHRPASGYALTALDTFMGEWKVSEQYASLRTALDELGKWDYEI